MKKINFVFLLLISFVFNQACIDAQALFDSEKYIESISMIKSNPEALNDINCNYLAYTISFKVENFDEAKNYLDFLLKKEPDNIDYLSYSDLLTKILQEYKSSKYTLDKLDPTSAISEFKTQLEDQQLSSISLFHNGLATAYKKKDKSSSYSDSLNFKYLDLSIKCYREALTINKYKDYDNEILNIAKSLTKKGKNSMQNDDYNSALKYFIKAIEYSHQYSTAHFYKGQLYMKLQDFKQAADSFVEGLLINDKNYKILYMTGNSFEKLGNLDKSHEFYVKALNIDPSYEKARFALGRVLFSKKQYDESIKELELLVKQNNKYSKAYELLVDIQLELNNLPKAKQYCLDGTNTDARSYPLFARLAGINNDQNEYNMAIENANKAIDLKRNYGPALIELGRANVHLCNKVAAEDAFNRAKRYDRRQVSQLLEWSKEQFKTVCN